MSSDRDLAAALAAEIRAAVAEIEPKTEPASPAPLASASEESARAALRKSQAHVTPVIPPAARLGRGKRLALRALRFLWRDQTTFNALIADAAESLLRALGEQREALAQEFSHVRRWTNDAIARSQEETRRALREWNDALERRSSIEAARLAALEAATAGRSAPPAPSVRPPPALPAGVYALFEERFRGTPRDVEGRQRSYLALLRDLPGPVLDVGCGRGEFLVLLAAENIPAAGIEINPVSAALCRERGLPVEEIDALVGLARAEPASLGAVVLFQVVEHWPAEATFAFLVEARRALAPGGVLIAETINTDSLSALKAFFLDPSHVRAVPPEALRFLAEAAGFSDVTVEYKADLPPEDRLAETSDNDRKLNALLFGPQDYAVIARVPRAMTY